MEDLNLYNKLSHEILGAAIEVHKELGPGLLESVYETCLFNVPVLKDGVRRRLNGLLK